MALLRAVAFGWRQEQLAENARRISDLAARLHQGLAVWTQHLSGLGQSLDRASKAYNAAVGSLERTVLPPARRLKEFGVSTRDEIGELNPLETALRGISQSSLDQAQESNTKESEPGESA
jgi:DNA recombination protein RmuC